MDSQIIAIVAVAIPMLGFLWSMRRDVAGLHERMARLEGLFERFVKRPMPANRKSVDGP